MIACVVQRVNLEHCVPMGRKIQDARARTPLGHCEFVGHKIQDPRALS